MEIRDLRNGSWFWVNNAVNACRHITPLDKTVYGAIASFAGESFRPANADIADRCGGSERRVRGSIKALEGVGLLKVVRGQGGRGKVNAYELLKCLKGCELCANQERVTKSPSLETRTISAKKGDNLSGTLYKNTKQNPNTATGGKAAPPRPVSFDFKEYLARMHDHRARQVQIIAFYFEEKGLKFDNLGQAQTAIRRHLRAAKELVPFTDQQIVKAAREARRDFPRIWTIETLVKILTK